MSSMPWVKMYTEMLDDPKIGRLSDAVKWRFVSLILLAGECDKDGYLSNGNELMTVDDIAWRMRITREQCEKDLESLVNCGLIDDIDGAYFVVKFSERQGRPQSEKRAQWRERKARQNQKQEITQESRVNHATRVEKSREEIASDDAPANEEIPQTEPRKPSERQTAIKTLEEGFSKLSNIPLPKRGTAKEKSAAASTWWNPLGETWELCGKNTAAASKLIEASYKKLIGEGMTVSSPQSLVKTATALHAQGNGNKTIKITGVVHA